MAIIHDIFNTLADFAAWLQDNAVPSIFKSVTYDSETDEMTATDSSDNTVWAVKNGSGGYFRAYRGENDYIGFELSTIPNLAGGATGLNCILCQNGLIVGCSVVSGGYGRSFAFLISKTNNDKLAFIFRSTLDSTAGNQYKNALNHVAWGDSTTITTTTTFVPEAAQQTILCPFATNANVGTISYTPYAFYMPVCQNYDSGINKFITSGKQYITNGYWAIDASET